VPNQKKYPGDKKARAAWGKRFSRYCNNIGYPVDKRTQGNVEYQHMRQLWVTAELIRLAPATKTNINAVPAPYITADVPLPNVIIPPNTNSPTTQAAINTAVNIMTKAPIQKLTNRPFGRKKPKPPPTGFHSPKKITNWLVYYLPDLFRGDAKTLKKTIHKSIFKALKKLSKVQASHTKSKKARLYFGQRRMLKWMKNNPWAAFEVFRSAGKTQLAIGLLVYLICENTDLRLFLLSEEFKKTKARVRLVRKLLVSKKIVEDYGYLINEGEHGKSTEDMFQCFRTIDAIEPTLMAITWRDAKALGFHFDGGILDDPWSAKLQREEGAKERWLDWWGEFRFCLENAQFCWMLRTRKAVHDLYEELDKKQLWAVYRQKLVLKFPSNIKYIENTRGVVDDVTFNNDYIIFDECFGKYSMKNLLLLQHEYFLYFEREIQNNPYIIEGNVLKWMNINLYHPNSADIIVRGFHEQMRANGSGIVLIKIMDMAFGQSKKADYNVLLVLGKYKNRYFIIKAWVGRWDFAERLSAIRDSEERFPGIPLYIEADFIQNSIVNDIKKALPHLRILKFQSRGKGKEKKTYYEGSTNAAKKGKIHDAVVVPWGDGRIYVNASISNLRMLKEQSAQFPNCDYFDYLDAVAMGFIVLRPKGSSFAAFA